MAAGEVEQSGGRARHRIPVAHQRRRPGTGPSRSSPPSAFRACSTCAITATRSSFRSGRSRATATSRSAGDCVRLDSACEPGHRGLANEGRHERRTLRRRGHRPRLRGAHRRRSRRDGRSPAAATAAALAAALERELARGAAAIISFGIAGGLAAAAAAGNVAGRRCRDHAHGALAGRCRLGRGAARHLPGAVRGELAGADAIIARTGARSARWAGDRRARRGHRVARRRRICGRRTTFRSRCSG